jgi:hypothetical protein
MTLTYLPYDAATVKNLRDGGPDAYGHPAEHAISDGVGNPCRCCLNTVPEGAAMLICAARPFPSTQPYAETGPIFLCADDCAPHAGHSVPPILQSSPDYLVKSYCKDDRIIYGTGQITLSGDIATYATDLLARDDVAYVDVRSARNNCFLTRIIET